MEDFSLIAGPYSIDVSTGFFRYQKR